MTMADPVRPTDVNVEATCIVPGLTQQSTIASIEHTTMHENLQVIGKWMRGLRDWKPNAQAAKNAGQDIPPVPRKDPMYTVEVTYADMTGKTVPDSVGEATHAYYAWVETVEM